jgi:hypothetical protein
MRYWCLVLLMALMLPALAGEPVANIKLIAFEYFDEVAREWYQIESISIREITGSGDYVERSFYGAEKAEATLQGLNVNSQYQVMVRWDNGTTMQESYTVYEPGNVQLWVDVPDNY